MLNFLKKRNKDKESDKEYTFQKRFGYFQALLRANDEAHKAMSELSELVASGKPFTKSHANHTFGILAEKTEEIAVSLSGMSGGRYLTLTGKVNELTNICRGFLTPRIYCREAFDCDLPDCSNCEKYRKISRKKIFVSDISKIDDSLSQEFGSKMSRLGELRNKLNIPVPEGFGISRLIFEQFLKINDMRLKINELLRNVNFDEISEIRAVSREIQNILVSEPVPEYLQMEIYDVYDKVFADCKDVRLAVRSSAIGEDSLQFSFAGLHHTALNVRRENIIDAAWEVLNSKYSPQSLVYRYINGIRDEDMPMSVACMKMIDSAISGVIFTADPNGIHDGMLIQAVLGLGSLLVEGRVTPQQIVVEHSGGAKILQFSIGWQDKMEIAKETEGTEREKLAGQQTEPYLNPEQISTLAGFALRIEEHFGTPQDIEWAIDRNGTVFILQARPLKVKAKSTAKTGFSIDIQALDSKYTSLIDSGDCASPGIAAGSVFHINNISEQTEVPKGCIVVARKNTPEFAGLIHKVSGFITDIGSTTGHLSIIARERNIPVLTNTITGSKVLNNGESITLFADKKRVYGGLIPELEQAGPDSEKTEEPFRNSPLYKIWHRIGKLIFKLNLIDPNSQKFSAQYCETYHDIIRYAHEIAMKIMFSIYENRDFGGSRIFSMKFDIPLDLNIIDLGGGVAHDINRKWVRSQDINSKPFQALIEGMSSPGVRWSGYISIDTKGFTDLILGNIIDSNRDRNIGSASYALVSENYVNFFSRLGYHFSRLDAYATEERNNNYINFNFRGGASDIVRRTRRAIVVRRILEKLNFSAIINDDNVVANIRKVPEELIYTLVKEIGRLLGAVRNVDVVMLSEEFMDEFVDAFLSGDSAPAFNILNRLKN